MNRPLPTSIRLDPELKAALEKAATAEGRSLSNMVERILRDWLTVKPARGRSNKMPKKEMVAPDITVVAVEAKDGKPTGKTTRYKLTPTGLKAE